MLKRRKSKPVQESTDKSWDGIECCSANERNLRNLVKSGMLADFVKKNNGSWDHLKWLMLCDDITTKGYTPIDLDWVGMALEQEKDNYSEKKK